MESPTSNGKLVLLWGTMVAKQGQVGSSYVIKHFSSQQEIPQLTQIWPFLDHWTAS